MGTYPSRRLEADIHRARSGWPDRLPGNALAAKASQEGRRSVELLGRLSKNTQSEHQSVCSRWRVCRKSRHLVSTDANQRHCATDSAKKLRKRSRAPRNANQRQLAPSSLLQRRSAFVRFRPEEVVGQPDLMRLCECMAKWTKSAELHEHVRTESGSKREKAGSQRDRP